MGQIHPEWQARKKMNIFVKASKNKTTPKYKTGQGKQENRKTFKHIHENILTFWPLILGPPSAGSPFWPFRPGIPGPPSKPGRPGRPDRPGSP